MPANVPPSTDRRWYALLDRVCERCVGELEADHASIGIATGPAQLVPGAATSAAVAELEDFAFTVGEGPCFDAMRAHAPVVVADLTTQDALARWPVWSGAAARHDICGATALPIEAGAITAGVLSLYSRSAWQPDARQFAVARRLVDVALLVLLDMALTTTRTTGGAGPPADRAEDSADDIGVLLHADVHRAAGMIMVQAGLPIDQALARLRAHAFAAGRPLREVAADVLAGRLRFAEDLDPIQ